MRSLIYDWNQVERFYSSYTELTDDEVLFISLAARSKYLTDEEREIYSIGNAHMFGRTVIYDVNDLQFYFGKLHSVLGYKKTRTKQEFPDKCLVIYVNVNPSSLYKSYNVFAKKMQDVQQEFLVAAVEGKQLPFHGFRRMDRNILDAIQNTHSGKKVYLDIDFDSKDKNLLDEMLGEIPYSYVIETRGGFHILCKTSDLRKHKTNVGGLVRKYDGLVKASDPSKEVIINENGVIPLPGSLQGGFEVKFYEC